MPIVLLFLVFLLGACQTPTTEAGPPRHTVVSGDTASHQVQLSEWTAGTDDFKTFFRRFLRDSTFQLAHIDFPLKGYSTDALSTNGPPEEVEDTPFYWEKNTWNLWYDLPIDTIEYGLEQQVEKDRVSHYLFLKSSGFYLSYTFERREGNWRLIHYTEHNL